MAKWKVHEIWNLSDRPLVVEMFLVVFTYNLFQHGYLAWVEYSWMLGFFLLMYVENVNKACRYIVANNRLKSIYSGSRHRLECEDVYAERQMDVRARPVLRWALAGSEEDEIFQKGLEESWIEYALDRNVGCRVNCKWSWVLRTYLVLPKVGLEWEGRNSGVGLLTRLQPYGLLERVGPASFQSHSTKMVRGELYGPLGPQWTNTETEFSRWTQENGLWAQKDRSKASYQLIHQSGWLHIWRTGNALHFDCYWEGDEVITEAALCWAFANFYVKPSENVQ